MAQKKFSLFRSALSVFIFVALFLFSGQHLMAQNTKQSFKTVVLDAGHGGKDAGALKYKMEKHEKDIALDIVLKLGKLINDSLPHIKVVYTRTTDVFIPLATRHQIANNAKGDLFISVHVNATAGTRRRVANGYRYVGKGKNRRKVRAYKTIVNRETKATGTETYVLGLHRNNQKSKAIEDYGDNVTEEAGLLDPNDPTTQILVAQYTQAFLAQSVYFGDMVQQNFEKQGRKNAGVKQKGLEVLAGSAMPGVLVETGFINNPEDEAFLNSDAGQKQMVWAIYQAIKVYSQEQNKKL